MTDKLSSLEQQAKKSIEQGKEIKKLTEELMHKESEIIKQNYFMDSVLTIFPGAIYLYDFVNHRQIWTNGKVSEILGFTRDDQKGMGVELFKGLMDGDEYRRYLDESEKYKDLSIGSSITNKYRLRDAEGNLRWFNFIESKYSKDSILGIMIDVTKEKETLDRLILQTKALNSAKNGIIITDTLGKIVFVNESYCDATGYTYREFIGKSPSILKSGRHNDDFYKNMWDTITNGKIWSGYIYNKYKNGEIHEEKLTISPVVNGKINYFIAIKEYLDESGNPI